MTDTMTIEEFHEYQNTGRLPRRLKKQRSEVLMAVADDAPDLLDQAAGAKRESKYGATKTEVDGYMFDSKAEANRYSELKQMMLGGLIANLELQPTFELTAHGIKIGTYIGDFAYRDLEHGVYVVEDVKSNPTMTPIYRWKKKHVKAQYGIEIVEVMS